jgi:hypothetical protein
LDRAHVLPDLPKTEWFFGKWVHTLDDTESRLHKEFSLLIPPLTEFKLTPDFPDFIGEAVHRVGEACFRSLQENRSGQFRALFPLYFAGIFGIVGRIGQKTPEYDIEALVPFLVEPLMDLVALSGYAYAWAQFHQNRRLWHLCTGVWDCYLHQPAARPKMESLATGIRYRRSLFGLTPRDVLRARWEQIFDGAIRSLPRVVDSGSGEFGLSTRPEHPSCLIQVIGAHELGSLYDGIDIFVAIYLSRHPLAGGIDFGRDDLGESLRRIRRPGDADNDEDA